MRNLSKVVLAGSAALLAGTALAANPKSKVLEVPLGDGSVVKIQYYGDVAPRVTVLPRQSHRDFWSPALALPSFDRMIADMQRRTAEMMRLFDGLARMPATGAPGVNLAAAGTLPAGSSSYSVVSVTNNGRTCTRTTEVVSQGEGKPPKMTSKVSGDCGSESRPAPAALDHT
jgi:hypothetical protein